MFSYLSFQPTFPLFFPQLVENVATCLIKIADRVGQSPEMMEELCKHGVVHQVTHLIDLNSRTTLGQPIHTVCKVPL